MGSCFLNPTVALYWNVIENHVIPTHGSSLIPSLLIYLFYSLSIHHCKNAQISVAGNHNDYFWSADFYCVFTLHSRLLLNEVSEVFIFSIKKADFTTWPDEGTFKKQNLHMIKRLLGIFSSFGLGVQGEMDIKA